MLLNDSEVNERLSSPLNLINRLRANAASKASSTFLPPAEISSHRAGLPAMPPSVDDLVDDIEGKIKASSITGKAIDILSASMDELKIRISEVSNPAKLSTIAKDMSGIINTIRGERTDGSRVQVLVYAPQLINSSDFQVVHVNE